MRTDNFVGFVMRRLKLRCDADPGVNMTAFGSIMMIANNGKYSLFMSVSSIKKSGRPAMRLKSKKQNMFLASKVSSHHH